MTEIIKVRTQSRLYVGAKLEITLPGPAQQKAYRRVVREDAACGSVAIVAVEPTLVCLGDWTIEATILETL